MITNHAPEARYERAQFEEVVRGFFDPARASELLARDASSNYIEWGLMLAWEAWQARAALTSTPPAAPEPPINEAESVWLTLREELHPNTVNLVVRFARALAKKLAEAEKKYGYADGWRSQDWMDECRLKLLEHISKGDPRDVAAYCAFLWHHGERTTQIELEPPAQLMALLQKFGRLHRRMGELWERCQGKGWPEPESSEFTLLRDEAVPLVKSELLTALTIRPAVVGTRDAEAELNCAEEVLDGLAAQIFLEQTAFNCVGDYITAVVDEIRRQHVDAAPERQALQDIVYPMSYLERTEQLGSKELPALSDPAFYQLIASQALAASRDQQEQTR